LNVLAIGAHPDDLELGCFGVLELHRRKNDKLFGLLLTHGEKGGNPDQRQNEAMDSAKSLEMELSFGEYNDGYVPHDISTVSMIEKFIVDNSIDIVYAPSVNDRHQDHRNIGLSVLVSGRKAREVYAYETISCTNDFHPTLYVDITSSMDIKRKCLAKHLSQDHRTYIKNYEAFNRYRSLKIDKPNRYHEVFEVIKLVK
jgi:LmbE family N-acetylglucosaminyl deacetylase